MTTARPVRLLMTADAVGGVWQYAADLSAGLAAHGFETLLAVLGPAPNDEQRAHVTALTGVRLLETNLPLDWLSDAGGAEAAGAIFAALARREGADLVHLNSPALAASRDFTIPAIGAVHGCPSTWWEAARPGLPLDPAFAWHRNMMASGLRACDRVISPTVSYAETVRRHYRLPVPPTVVHNGRAFASPPAKAMSDFAFTAGRLWDDVKNAAVLDAAAERLPFPFHAAGSLIAPHGEAKRLQHINALGQIDAVALADCLAARPVFVSAATFEPFGLAVLEAATSGCALVLSDIATFRELWDGAAVFVDPDDAAGFARAIECCVQDVPQRLRLGEAARERARRYSVERMVTAMAAQYAQLVATRAAA